MYLRYIIFKVIMMYRELRSCTGGSPLQAENLEMGLRARFLTASVGIPIALWGIFHNAQSFIALALVLQGICIHELSALLDRTRCLKQVSAFSRGGSLSHMVSRNTKLFGVIWIHISCNPLIVQLCQELPALVEVDRLECSSWKAF